MANFCGKCGAPVSGSFCTGCGSPTGVSPIAPTPVTAAPQTVKPSGNSLAKILLIVGGIILFIGFLVVGGLVFVGYKAKQKLDEIRTEMKTDESRPVQTTASSGSGCKYLSGQEAAQILGITVERVESKKPGAQEEVCEYYVSVAERKRLATVQIATAFKGLGGDSTADQNVKNSEKLVAGWLNTIVNSAGNADTGPAMQLNVEHEGGKEKMSGLGSTVAVMKPIDDLGDKAYMLPAGLGLVVLKGDAAMRFAFAGFAPGPEKTVALGRLALARLK